MIDTFADSSHPDRSWAKGSADLPPAREFDRHVAEYDRCYGENAHLRAPGPAWWPTADVIARANVTAVAKVLGLADYLALHRWSVQNRAAFWDLAIRRLGIVFRTPYKQVVDASQPTRPRWLIGATMNIVESCLLGEPNAPAILESDGTGPIRTTTYGQLKSLTARVANGLAAIGIAPGDTVAVVAPMTAASVATYLGIIAAGAAVVSIADSFAADEIATRLRISGAKLVLTQDFTPWGAKKLPLYDKVKAATELPIIMMKLGTIPPLPSGERAGVRGETPDAHSRNSPADSQNLTPHPASPLRGEGQEWLAFLSDNDTFAPVPRQPADTVNILFSSGTTGEPKAIPWDHTTPLKCGVDAHFHHDLHPGDISCWPTNLGWMMGPWLIFASLLNRGAMALYAQAPHERGFGQFVQDAGVTMLGSVPSLVRAWRASNCMEGIDWSKLRAFSSSGECSNASDMLYLMHLAGYRPVIEYCGGTEIGGGYVTGTVVQPCIPATFTTPALGIDIQVPSDERAGEAFLVGPSIGLSTRLLNRDHDAVYFKDTPTLPDGTPLRRHGDELESLPDGYYRVAGRSDDTMNLGGIKVGCAELERALSSVPGVHETAAVAVPPPGGGPSRLIVFTVLKPGVSASAASLKPQMQQAIRDQLNPLFRLEEVRLIDSLPRTASNKVMRRELRALVQG